MRNNGGLFVYQQIAKTKAEWLEENPIVPERVLVFETDTLMMRLGDGKRHFADLEYRLSAGLPPRINRETENWEIYNVDTKGWDDTGLRAYPGSAPRLDAETNLWEVWDDEKRMYVKTEFQCGSAYDLLVKYGGYKGTMADFCRQLDNFTRYGEQQVGQLVNAGAGWNSFTFPQEFSEEVYVTLTPVNCPCYAVVKNVTKQGFHYCLYTHEGNTTANNEVVNWNACTVSELNLARAMAQAAGLNPFDYDNLTQLFTAHAAEVVANEAALRMMNNSSMASGRYLCHLSGLNPDSYVNVFSIAKDIAAMNTVCQNEDCMAFIATSPTARDSIKLADIGTTKYALTLAGLAPTKYDSMAALCENEADITAVAASATAMQAVAASATSLIAIALSEVAIGAVFGDETAFSFIDNEQSMGVLAASPVAMAALAASPVAMAALAASPVAMAALAASPVALRAIALSATRETFEASEYFAEEILETDSGIAMYAAACAELEPAEWTTMQSIAASAVAMQSIAASAVSLSAIASSETARNAVLGSEHWSAIAEDDRAITRYTLALAGRDTEEFASMSALAASATAMAAVAASATALSACASSAVSMEKICSSPMALNIMLKTDSTRNSLCSSRYLQTNYSNINSSTNNTTYFVKTSNNIDSGSYRAKSDGTKESSSVPNQSLYLSFKIGAWSDGTSVTGKVSHMQDSKLVLSKSTSSGGGQSNDTPTSGGVRAEAVCIGGCKFTESSDAYTRGYFVYAKD